MSMTVAEAAAIVAAMNNTGGGGGAAGPLAMFDLVAFDDWAQGSLSVVKGDFSKTRQKLLEGGLCQGCYYSWDDEDYSTFTYYSISMKYIEPDQDAWGERIIVKFFVFDEDESASYTLAAAWYPDNTISTE